PDRFDMLAFGPSAISFAGDNELSSARKILNPDGAAAYRAAVASGDPVWDRYFIYDPRDLRVFYLTRRLAALTIDRLAYRAMFAADAFEHFPRELEAIAAEFLVDIGPEFIRPTPRGMFYADSIASLFAWRRTRSLSSVPSRLAAGSVQLNDNSHGYM